jgi:hypothetical protein
MNEDDFLLQLLMQQQNAGNGFLGATTFNKGLLPTYASAIMNEQPIGPIYPKNTNANTNSFLSSIPNIVSSALPAVAALAAPAAAVGTAAAGVGAAAAGTAAAGTAGATAAAGGLGATLGAAIPFVGLGITAASMVASYIESDKQKAAEREAKREAEKAAVEMQRLQEQNFYEKLNVPLEAYDRQFREGTAANAQAIEALSQDPRTLLGGIQGVQEATIEGQAQTREKLADRLFNLDVMKAQAATQQADDLSKIEAEKIKGAQIAAMAAEKAKIAQQQSALQGVGGLITQGAGMIGTYGELATPEDRLSGLSSSLKNTMFAPKQENTTQAIMQLIKNNPALLAQLTQTS